MNALTSRLGSLRRNSDIMLAIAVVVMVMILIVPLPAFLLDFFLVINIVLAVSTLLITTYTQDALEFSSFPSLILFLTLFRLGLNIAATRMILAKAEAGHVIQTFGSFVTEGNQVVGLVIFVLLTIINFVVITKGSGRIAEVGARFTLDAMPGKQMSIDADLNAGVIDEKQARERREKVTAEADFYGAMDGASKFVRGDAIAGIIMTCVNIIGGLTIGVAMKGMDWMQAVTTYVNLTIGDGLVSQIPALLISVAAGVIVTRASNSEALGHTFQKQMFNNPRVLYVVAGIVVVISLIPGMPKLIMWPVSAAIGYYAYSIANVSKEELEALDAAAAGPGETAAPAPEVVEKALFVDPMEVELGYGLIPLVDKTQGGDLLARINVIRRQIASELGIIVPPIRIRDNMLLEPDVYVIKIKGIEIAHGSLQLDSFLAMNPGNADRPLQGIATTEPAFGLPATWINAAQRESAEMLGYTVVDTLSVLATHLTELIHAHAHELLTRQDAQHLIDNAKEFASAVIEELIPNVLTLGQVLKVLQNLLKERISIRDIVTILETLADNAHRSTDIDVLTEYVRHGLARTISKQYSDQTGVMHVITLDPRVEQMIVESVQRNEFGTRVVLRPATTQKILDEIQKNIQKASSQGLQAVTLTSSTVRMHLRRLVERSLPRLPVLSFHEIIPEVQIRAIGAISSEVLM